MSTSEEAVTDPPAGAPAEPSVAFDADGIFFKILEAENDVKAETEEYASVLTRWHDTDPSVHALRDLYYLEAHSAMVLVGKPDAKILACYSEWGRSCLRQALLLTHRHLQEQAAHIPSWLHLYLQPLTNVTATQYPDLHRVKFAVAIEPRFYARALAPDCIALSALTRTFLRHNNLTLWTLIEDDVTAGRHIFAPADVRTTARMLLPQLIYGHDNIPVGRLPILGAPRIGLFSVALVTTRLQTMFLMAHELGHIALRHFERSRASESEKVTLELEADTFAFTCLLEVITRESNITTGDLWTAVRWLYQFQLLDELVGALLHGTAPVLERLAFEARKNNLYALVPLKEIDHKDNLLEVRGTFILMQLKAALIKLGSPFLRSVADELAQAVPGPNAQWWEAVRNADATVVNTRDGDREILRRDDEHT